MRVRTKARQRLLRGLRLACVGSVVFAAGCAHRSVVVPEPALPAIAETDPAPALPDWRVWFDDPTLEALIDEALENNHELKMAVHRVAAARARVRGSVGASWPSVDGVASGQLDHASRYTQDGADRVDGEVLSGVPLPNPLGDVQVGLVASWEVDLWGRLRSLRGAALERALATEEAQAAVRSLLIAEVATTWFDLLVASEKAAALGRAVQQQTRALEVVQVQHQAGRETRLAVHQFQSQLSGVQAERLDAAQEVQELEGRLNVLLGRFEGQVPLEREALFSDATHAEALRLSSEQLRARPDVREAERGVAAARYDVQAAKAAFFPTVELSATVGLHAFNPAYLLRLPESVAASVLGGLVAPLVNRAAIREALDVAEAEQLEALHGYQQTVLEAFVEVVNGLARVERTTEGLRHRLEQQAAMEQGVEIADVLFRTGRASYLEVLLAQQAAVEAELGLLNAARERQLARVQVFRALGGGAHASPSSP